MRLDGPTDFELDAWRKRELAYAQNNVRSRQFVKVIEEVEARRVRERQLDDNDKKPKGRRNGRDSR